MKSDWLIATLLLPCRMNFANVWAIPVELLAHNRGQQVDVLSPQVHQLIVDDVFLIQSAQFWVLRHASLEETGEYSV